MEQGRKISTLNGSVLVLNRFYMAVHVVSVRRALVLLYRELAEVIHVDDGQYFNYDFGSWLELSEFARIDAEEEQLAEEQFDHTVGQRRSSVGDQGSHKIVQASERNQRVP